MSLYQKLKLLLRASAEEPARKLVALNDIKIFEQEIFEAEGAIKAAKLHLASVKAEAKSVANSIDELTSTIALRERQTIEALEKDEELARELAGLIAEDEVMLKELLKQRQHLNSLDTQLTRDLRSAVRAIQSHYRQIQILKANQPSLHGNQGAMLHAQSLNGTLRDLKASLESIKQRQRRTTYLDEAESEVDLALSGNHIDERLASSGISTGKHDSAAVLERLRLKRSA